MQYVKFIVDETPFACWDHDLKTKNLEFLRGIDPQYFRHSAEILASSSTTSNEKYTALMVRSTYSHAPETLFALLGTTLQAPYCAVGWMLKYRNYQLNSLISKIHKGQHVYHSFKTPKITWESLVNVIHSPIRTEDPEEADKIKRDFGTLWRYFAMEFLNQDRLVEFNNTKHGLRVRPGGFYLRMGKGEASKTSPSDHDFVELGGSKYGSSFFKDEAIGKNTTNFRPRYFSMNWDPESLCQSINSLSFSIENIIIYLRLANGDDSENCHFRMPANKEAFSEPWGKSVGITNINLDTKILEKDISPFSAEDILKDYEDKTSSDEDKEL